MVCNTSFTDLLDSRVKTEIAEADLGEHQCPDMNDDLRLDDFAGTKWATRWSNSTETLLKLALPAPQGSGNAAGRLTMRGRPAAARQLDDLLGPPRPRTID